jgi:hypothetical protein
MLRRLRSRLQGLGLRESEQFFQQLDADIERVMVGHSRTGAGERARPHLRLAACVLASYNALASGPLDPQRAQELVEDVCASIGRTPQTLQTQALLTLSGDPFSAITRSGKQRAPQQNGGDWEFRLEEAGRCFTMTATKCFYHEFFSAARAPQLTHVFCRWDENWVRPIDPVKHGIQFERPTTMAHGGHECPFIFRRVTKLYAYERA